LRRTSPSSGRTGHQEIKKKVSEEKGGGVVASPNEGSNLGLETSKRKTEDGRKRAFARACIKVKGSSTIKSLSQISGFRNRTDQDSGSLAAGGHLQERLS